MQQVTQQVMQPTADGQRYQLFSPTAMPAACSFLWNPQLLLQLNCRGFATAQFMQPEPAKYAHAPVLEAKTFMQPEQPYFAHHPGRFVYFKDEQNGSIFSLPYEPARQQAEQFCFSVGKSDVQWQVQQAGLALNWQVSVSPDAPHELWQLTVQNTGAQLREISIYPYFPVGYMSWMNQSGDFDAELNAVVCQSVTPYQKYPDFYKQQFFKDQTFLLAEQPPIAWCANQSLFEGEGGLQKPDALLGATLANQPAHYQTPVCAMQYRLILAPGESRVFRFVFGPAYDKCEIAAVRQRYFGDSAAQAASNTDGFTAAQQQAAARLNELNPCLQINTPDETLNNFVNHWLPRQQFYHGDSNRFTTDPQTRNYLQDHMGMCYLKPASFREALRKALSQQHASGEMPDGILLHHDATLKYINQVPHTDQCVWLPVCLSAYLAETDDYALLDELLPFSNEASTQTVFEHLKRAMTWLVLKKDPRGLNYIEQGDWCDPMNMVGFQGRGVSGWLSLASAYALNCFAEICQQRDLPELATHYQQQAAQFNLAVNSQLWDGNWYGRGITDDGRVFGVSAETEGRIYLNPQSWAMLSGAADASKIPLLLNAIQQHLQTPYGVQMLAPAYTRMVQDIGRLTQKFPGSAENGSVYNHAVAFYLYALYQIGEPDLACTLLKQMLPSDDVAEQKQRGQLPVFIPNYYRGAYQTLPGTAGRSSQLFNTGTVAWVYRALVEGMFGVKGCADGLRVEPQLPSQWPAASIVRLFRGARFDIQFRREEGIAAPQLWLDRALLPDFMIRDFHAGQSYQVTLLLPLVSRS
ncbi:NdvB protein [Rheinheimera riviphila]|uniref:NdvB protein n=2 Tax=Rheinheimera riviphila TaxID=1834037 RepID=A0A437R1H9_9GAMM|nr:NdvB protein [Rheinheimera riviphila]